jgi:hypothetical protein
MTSDITYTTLRQILEQGIIACAPMMAGPTIGQSRDFNIPEAEIQGTTLEGCADIA